MTDQATEILKLDSITKRYGQHEVLRGVTLAVQPREVVAILGVSGSGKSTLLRCANLLEVPTTGNVVFDGTSVDYREPRRLRRAATLRRLRTEIGMVFQSYNLWPHMTVLENVIEAPQRVKKLARRDAVEHAETLLAGIGLAEKRNEYPSRLSGGQQQRVAIVRAMAMSPKVMLLDEVTSALDPELVGEVLDLIARLAESGMTMLIVTHEVAFARAVSHRTIFIDEGLIEEEGPSAVVLSEPRNVRTKRFLQRVLHQRAG